MSGFDYFHEGDVLDYSFYTLPKELFNNPLFEKLSIGSKVLYCVLLDRLSLSKKNGWIDEYGGTYIYYSVKNLESLFKVSHTTITKWFRELDTTYGVGLIERNKVGFNKPSVIYVKKFIVKVKDLEEPNAPTVVKKVALHSARMLPTGAKESFPMERKNLAPINTNISDTDFNNTNINMPCREAKLKAMGRFENVSMTEDELGRLKQDYPYEYDNLIDRLSDYMASTGKRYKNHYATICLWAEKDKKDSNAVVYKFEEGECL